MLRHKYIYTYTSPLLIRPNLLSIARGPSLPELRLWKSLTISLVLSNSLSSVLYYIRSRTRLPFYYIRYLSRPYSLLESSISLTSCSSSLLIIIGGAGSYTYLGNGSFSVFLRYLGWKTFLIFIIGYSSNR